MVFSYSFDSAIRLTLDEAQGKAQEYVLFVSTIASLLEHCASTPFRRFVANTLPPTPGPFTNTRAPACFTRTRSPFLRFLRRRLLLPPFPPPLSSPHFPHLLLSLSLSLSRSLLVDILWLRYFAHYRTGKRRFLRYRPFLLAIGLSILFFHPSSASLFFAPNFFDVSTSVSSLASVFESSTGLK